MLLKYLFYINWGFQTLVFREKIPLNGSIILTDKCNLNCLHCTVAHLGYPQRSIYDVEKDIRTLFDRGVRVLVITGGEPFMWKDAQGNTVEDVVAIAREMGFFRIVICTNGTYRLESSADYLWVSLDGYEKAHNIIRGSIYSKVIDNINQSTHNGLYINFTVSSNNYDTFIDVAKNILKMKNIRGILFLLYTKYIGGDESLVLEQDKRKDALKKIQVFKIGHPFSVFNTFSGISALKSGRWARNTYASVTINQGLLSDCCCRIGIYDKEVCENCGCTPAVETWALQTFKLSAIFENFRYL